MLAVEDLRSIAGGMIGIAMSDGRRIFAKRIRSTIQNAAAAGRLGSGMLHRQLEDLHTTEVRRRALEIWAILHRVVSTAGVPLYPDQAVPLKATAIDYMVPEVEQLRNSLAHVREVHRFPQTSGERFDAAVSEAIELVRCEIELFLKALEERPGPTNTVQHIYHAPVGSVQTGPNAVAHVTQQVDPEAIKGLQQTLERIRDEVLRVESDAIPQKSEVLDLIGAADQELRGEKPRMLTLTGLLTAISGGIQTLPNVAPAYQVLKSAASHAGIPLP
jgi:hypothetical protein